jgi:hypothetical protein
LTAGLSDERGSLGSHWTTRILCLSYEIRLCDGHGFRHVLLRLFRLRHLLFRRVRRWLRPALCTQLQWQCDARARDGQTDY